MDICAFPWLFEYGVQVRSVSQRSLVCRWFLGSGQTLLQPEDFVRGKTFSKESMRKLHQGWKEYQHACPFGTGRL